MSDTNDTPTPKAPKAPAAPDTDARLAAAVATALRSSAAFRFGPPNQGPTARRQQVATAIKRGTDCRAAMAAAGYGRKFIDGHAGGFPYLLAKEGLLTEREALVAAAVAKEA